MSDIEQEKLNHLNSMIETDNTNTTEYSNSLLELFLLGDDEEEYDINIINIKLNEINLNDIANQLSKFL